MDVSIIVDMHAQHFVLHEQHKQLAASVRAAKTSINDLVARTIQVRHRVLFGLVAR